MVVPRPLAAAAQLLVQLAESRLGCSVGTLIGSGGGAWHSATTSRNLIWASSAPSAATAPVSTSASPIADGQAPCPPCSVSPASSPTRPPSPPPRPRPALRPPALPTPPPPASLSHSRCHASSQPEHVVYAGPTPASSRRVTLRSLRAKYAKHEPISMVTAYDYPSAVHVDQASIDILLVGDSVAMVVHGHDTTLPITMEDMLVHCRAVARGSKRAFLVGDMPFGSYETSVRDAVASAIRMLKEGGMDAVKLEGGSPARVEAARAIVEAGVAVMGHVGLTPQSISVLGGFRPQAQVADEALSVLDRALRLQEAGCFSIVLECVPAPIAAAITRALRIPTLGIGAGAATSGQVLVYHDLLGMMSHPHHAKVTPKFCKQYAHVGAIIQDALQRYRDEVSSGEFPSAAFSPYRIPEQEVTNLSRELRARGLEDVARAVEEEAHRESLMLQQEAARPKT